MLLLAIVLLLLLPGEALASQQRPNVTRCSHCDNVPFKNDANVVKLFGLCVSARACEARCLNYNNSIPGSKAWDDGWEGKGVRLHRAGGRMIGLGQKRKKVILGGFRPQS